MLVRNFAIEQEDIMAKLTFADWQTPEQRAATERQWRRDQAHKRRMCNFMAFWHACTKPRCRRNRTCSGDPEDCFQLRWGCLAEADKEWVRGCILAAQNTRSKEEIERAGDAARDAYLKSVERFAKQQPAVARPAETPADTPAEPQVRIRRL
jgi:hypothetical protein